MSEERLQEIKDSVEFQYKLAKVKCIDNALLFADEEKELIDEIERLNNELQIQIEDNVRLNEYIEEQDNIIKEVREYIKENEKEYGSLEDNEKIILDILDKGE